MVISHGALSYPHIPFQNQQLWMPHVYKRRNRGVAEACSAIGLQSAREDLGAVQSLKDWRTSFASANILHCSGDLNMRVLVGRMNSQGPRLAHLIAVQADVELQDAGGCSHQRPCPRVLHHHIRTIIGESPRTATEASSSQFPNAGTAKNTISALCALTTCDSVRQQTAC